MIASQSVAELGLQFLECSWALDTAACAEKFRSIVRQIGFDSSACGAWAGIGRNRKHRFFFVDWPRSWLEFYEREGFFQHDMAAMESRRRVSSFWVHSVLSHLRLSPKQKELVEAFTAFGWKDVFAVPIHGPGSLQGLVTMVTREDLTLSNADTAVLEIMARVVWERCRISEGFGLSGPERPQLSAREVECLQWAAAGKSDTDIAVLLGVKPATAHFHIEQAKKKLGVKTRVEAAAVGVLHGLI